MANSALCENCQKPLLSGTTTCPNCGTANEPTQVHTGGSGG